MKCCAKCHQIKPLTEFGFKNKQKKLFVSYCKECNRAYQREHYKNNRSDYLIKHQQWRTEFRKEIRTKIIEYLKTHPCVDCGENDYAVLEFDHINGNKKTEVSSLLSNDSSWKTTKQEIEKCEVRCANCHRRRSAKQLGWYKYIIVE